MGITNKPCVLAAAQFRNHVDQVSKAALIDLVWALLNRMRGEEEMRGAGIEQFDEAFAPVARERRDKMPKRFAPKSATEGTTR